MGKLLNFEILPDRTNQKPIDPKSDASYAQPWIIDIADENVTYEELPNPDKEEALSEGEAPPWFTDLKADFDAEDEQIRPLNMPPRGFNRPKKGINLKAKAKKKLFPWYIGIGFGILVITIVGIRYATSKSSDKVVSSLSQEGRADFLASHTSMSEEQLRSSLVKFLESFYFDQSAASFDLTSYFANHTETYYDENSLSLEQLKKVHNKRLRGMFNLKQNWVLSSLDFYRNGSEVILTYWIELSYLKRSFNKQEAADIKNEMIIDENGKIISLRQLKVKNFTSRYVKNEHDDFRSMNGAFATTDITTEPFKSTFSAPVQTALVNAGYSEKEHAGVNISATPEFTSAALAQNISHAVTLPAPSVSMTAQPVSQANLPLVKEKSAEKEKAVEVVAEDRLYDYGTVEVSPEYPGGLKALSKFLAGSIRYPERAFDDGVNGKVFISFIVEKNGSLSDFKIVRGIGAGCDEETLRIMKASPSWKPGTVGGRPVRSSYMLPVKFQIAN